ncbi:MAG: nucleotide exchange factor GrpE [Armatimonadaceae bacterium]|jgi:molecular chaperone GrpE
MSAPDETANADDSTTPTETQTDEVIIADLEQQVADANEARLRALAEFQNYRRRTDEERESLKGFLLTGVMESLLPIVDNFGRAVESMNASSDIDKLRDGISGIHRQLATLLEKNGVEQIEADGAAFDPNLHNAVMRVEDSGAPADTVVEVLQPGYKIGGRVLRPALVKVSG